MRLTHLHAYVRTFAASKEGRFLLVLKKEFPAAEVYLVGGVVRDALLGRQTKDIDLVVRNVSAQKLEKFLKVHGEVNLVGKKFGVYKFVPKGAHVPHALDIALPRLEFSLGNTGHYRDFSIQSDHRLSLSEDLSRRDFTVNALAYTIFEKTLIDPWGGVSDIEKKVIRAVGEPHHRFTEDYSRMLRAIRFACQLNFTIHSHTTRAIKETIKKINSEVTIRNEKGKPEKVRAVPYEIISREIIKALVSDPVRALDLLDTLGVVAEVMPELIPMKKCPQPKRWHSEGDVWTHTRCALDVLVSTAFAKEFGNAKHDSLLVLATLLHDVGKPLCLKTPKKDKVDRIRFDGHDRVGADAARRLCERLRTSSVEGFPVDPAEIHWLIKNHLVILNCDLKTIKNTTIEKYFFRNPNLGSTLLKLNYVDGAASITTSGKTGLDRYRAFKKRLTRFKKTAGIKKELPKPILNGDEIMAATQCKAGPAIGMLLTLLREEQLSGRIKTKSVARMFVVKTAKKV